MGQKDLAAKQFERSSEVFADIINALIFEGDRVVFPKDLQPAPTESLYPAEDGMLRNQYSDVSKYEIRDGRIAMQYTLENQSRPDYKILLRKAGYEGAIYRQQYDGKDTYPAITLVLYWGDAAWNTSSDLYKFFRKKRIHGMARKYIDNVRLHMYSMRCLPQETRQRFRSDMRVVVDYLAEGEKYIPTDQEIVDVEATMRMLYALTGETNFIDNMEELQKRREEGGEITMGYAVSMYV
ncbi:MAG: Rpn family recombination-promoting nuclease/putative transposase, partial [Lachnospiraceae bacterium]|nr:Rpn family recombination-promoting nuclease/putative transposase [Lachnospiraceae bacterium]